MNRSRIVLIAIVAVAGSLLAGIILGRMGRGTLEQSHTQAELALDLERARVAILHARLELFGSNFGSASQHLDRARAPLQSALNRLNASDRDADAGRVQAALTAITEGQQLALAVNRDADAKATEALRGLDAIVLASGQ
jgi:hypothetical protein